MIHDWKMELYWRLPVPIQEAVLSRYASRLERIYYGPGYEELEKQYRHCRSWSRQTAREWQTQELRNLLQLAAIKVPFYRQAWCDINWRSIDSLSELSMLPLLSKQSLRLNESSFLVEGVRPGQLWSDRTSGTTGTSLTVYWHPDEIKKWWALYEIFCREGAGVSRHLPRAMAGGRPIVRGGTQRPPFWRFNRRWRQLYLSAYHVSARTVADYVEALRRHRPRWITGYGSAIAALAESALDQGLEPLCLNAAIVSGDTLLPNMRQAIEEFFQCKCFNHYGMSEGVCSAMECPAGRIHVIPAVGIIEIVDECGRPCPAGEVGEIVATGFLNHVMPLVRYRLGDYAAWAEDQECPCGNEQPVIEQLEGRVDDYLITHDLRRIGRLSTAIKRSPTIHSAQIVQDRPGHGYLLVKPAHGYVRRHAQAVQDDILERIGAFALQIVEVNDIPKTPQGKTILVVRLSERPQMAAAYRQLLGLGGERSPG